MVTVAEILSASIEAVWENNEINYTLELNGDTNILDSVDSFVVVDLLLETESRLENAFGRYISLADEKIFDAEKSPLKKWSDWLHFVESRLD